MNQKAKRPKTVFYSPTRLWLPPGVCNWPYLEVPRPGYEGDMERQEYSVDIYYPSMDELMERVGFDELVAAFKQLNKENAVALSRKTALDHAWQDVIIDGQPDGRISIKAKCQAKRGKPSLFGSDKLPLDAQDVYAGCYITARVQPYMALVHGVVYCRCQIIGIMKIAEGERLAGARPLTGDELGTADVMGMVESIGGDAIIETAGSVPPPTDDEFDEFSFAKKPAVEAAGESEPEPVAEPAPAAKKRAARKSASKKQAPPAVDAAAGATGDEWDEFAAQAKKEQG